MMYSKHAAALRASDSHRPHPQHSTMADTLTGRASHRLLNQQSLPKPFGALGETLPQRLGDAGQNVPANFHRRSIGGESGMLAYTEHAQSVNQRRYQYNHPQGSQGYATTGKITGNGMGRKWASLPKLNHQKEQPIKDEAPMYFNNRGEFRRPQSDIIHHEPPSRPNTPVRPASETNEKPHLSPRVRMRDYRHYVEQKQRGPNILSLTEEEANAFYEDDFETEDSGVEPELKDIPETPVESALNDLNQPNRNIEITPFPALVELNTQPAMIHSPSKAKPQMRNTKQVTDNGVWTKKGKTRTVTVTVNNNTHGSIKVLPDYPLTTVASDSRRHDPGDVHRSPVLSPRKPTQYSKQMSESAHYYTPDPTVSSRTPSLELDFNEVIIPGVEEEPDEEAVPEPKQRHQGAIPKHPPIVKELMANKNVPNQNHPAAAKTQTNPQSSSPTKELKSSQPPHSPTKEAKPHPKQPSSSKDVKSPQPSSPTKEVKSSPKPPPQSPTKSEKAKVQNGSSGKTGLPRDSAEEISDIAVTGSKVSSKPVPPSKDTKPKKTNQPQAVTRKPTPVQKPKPAKPAIRIPTGSSKSPVATPTAEPENNGSSKTAKATKENLKSKEPKVEVEAEAEEEDSLPELRGVLKAKGDGSKKGKKKSVQFGPKFVREVTKITYPWNEVDSDSADESDDDEDEDEDDSDIAEEIDEEVDTLISMQKDKGKDEIDRVGAENKTLNDVQKTEKSN